MVAVKVLRPGCIRLRCSIADMVSASLPSAAGAQSQWIQSQQQAVKRAATNSTKRCDQGAFGYSPR